MVCQVSQQTLLVDTCIVFLILFSSIPFCSFFILSFDSGLFSWGGVGEVEHLRTLSVIFKKFFLNFPPYTVFYYWVFFYIKGVG